jgi:hypothetical protein
MQATPGLGSGVPDLSRYVAWVTVIPNIHVAPGNFSLYHANISATVVSGVSLITIGYGLPVN